MCIPLRLAPRFGNRNGPPFDTPPLIASLLSQSPSCLPGHWGNSALDAFLSRGLHVEASPGELPDPRNSTGGGLAPHVTAQKIPAGYAKWIGPLVLLRSHPIPRTPRTATGSTKVADRRNMAQGLTPRAQEEGRARKATSTCPAREFRKRCWKGARGGRQDGAASPEEPAAKQARCGGPNGIRTRV